MSEIFCKARLLKHHKTLLPSRAEVWMQKTVESCLEVLSIKSVVKAFRFARSVLLLNMELNYFAIKYGQNRFNVI